MKGTAERFTESIKCCLSDGLNLHESPEDRYGYEHLLELVQMLPWNIYVRPLHMQQAYGHLAAKYNVRPYVIRCRIKDYIIAYYDGMYMPAAPDLLEASPTTGTLSNTEFTRRLIWYLKDNLI